MNHIFEGLKHAGKLMKLCTEFNHGGNVHVLLVLSMTEQNGVQKLAKHRKIQGHVNGLTSVEEGGVRASSTLFSVLLVLGSSVLQFFRV